MGATITVKLITSEEGTVRSLPDIVRTFLLPRFSSFASNGAVAGTFLAIYLVLEWVSFLHEYKGLPVTPWNPGLGVMFALMVRAEPWGGFVLFAGVVIAEIFVLQSKLEWPIVIGVGAITSLSYAFVAAVARRYLQLRCRAYPSS